MKKIYLFAILLGSVLVGCNPMEDIYEDMDLQVDPIVGDVTFTLSDDDYDDLDLGYGNFNSVDDAKTMLPSLLTGKYPVWGQGSSAVVSFNVYNSIDTFSKNIYELSDADHNAITGSTYGNFDRSYHIYDYLEDTYTSPEEGDFVSLRYRYYSGGESTLTNGFYYEDGDWNKIAGFTEEEYNAMGESYPNFSSHDEAEAKTPIVLLDVYKYNPQEPGAIVMTMYELYKGGGVTKSYTKNYIFDGSSWSIYTNEIVGTVQFGHDGATWVPDNTIKYTLTPDDFSDIGTALAATYSGPAGSAGNYGNFDRRVGNANEWTDAMVLEAVNIVLDNIAPGAAEGQKYVVTAAIYNGSAGTEDFAVIKTGGVWVYQ